MTALITVVSSAFLCLIVCGLFWYGAYVAANTPSQMLIDAPHPCVTGGPGSSAVFSNANTRLFTFPTSASDIDSSCTTWQDASIHVWFEMDPADQDAFIDSMRWDIQPQANSTATPSFGNPQPNIAYSYWEYSDRLETADVWIDTTVTPYRVYIYVGLY